MPNLMAIVIATLAAWLVKDALPTVGGLPVPLMIGFCVFLVVFPVARRLLSDIRPG